MVGAVGGRVWTTITQVIAPKFAAVVAAAALLASPLTVVGLASSSSAEATDVSEWGAPNDAPAATPVVATGLIVTTKSGKVSASLLKSAQTTTSIALASTRPVADDSGIAFAKAVPLATAQAAADRVAALPGVVAAEPDVRVTAAAASPVARNDPKFNEQYNVWDARPLSLSVPFPNGGYSVRAPSLWRATTGKKKIVVAVIDTGITKHVDLKGKSVAGYDFIKNEATANDGNGRDKNPADPGDYCAQASSWHGTHVAGIVAAKSNNGIGVTGVAPGVKFQSLRTLGRCGGTLSDTIDAIRWAAGGKISGVPKNKHRAQVINMSLTVDMPCSSALQKAINYATKKGVNVVAANGNEGNQNNVGGIGAPANCNKVISVHSTTEVGQHATYSNFGTTTVISAPGGGMSDGYSGIWSTLNSGTTSPVAASYASYEGTSMAAPAVAAGLALLRSLGYSQKQARVAVPHAVQGFPQYGGGLGVYPNCAPQYCGAGIFDLAQVPAPISKVKVLGAMNKGNVVSVSSNWTGGPALSYQWYRGSKRIKGATAATYTIVKADHKKKISVKVSGHKGGFKTLSRASKARKAA
ncbi:S8 family peptidase [soil metagenome]